MQTPFEYQDLGPDPHRQRRAALLAAHPELRRLIGYSWLTSAVILGIVAAQLSLAAWVQSGVDRGTSSGAWWFVLPLAFVVGGTLNHWAGMGIHEASHKLAARGELANRVMALVANVPMIVPAAMSFWRYHLDHHTHLGIEGMDNDLSTEREIRWVGRSPLRKLVWMALYPLFAVFARGFWRTPSRWEVLGVVFQLAVNLAIWHLLGGTALAYLTLSTLFGYGLLHPVAAHFIHEHYVWRPGQETYSYYGPLNWVTFHVGYHNEHHDIMSIPCWRLPEMRRIAPEFYRDLTGHRSWAGVLWDFVIRRDIGHDSRIVRFQAGAP